MNKSPEEIIQQGFAPEATEKEQQEALSLFHQEDMEYKVKEKLTDILNTTDEESNAGMKLQLLFEKIWNTILEKEAQKRLKKFTINTWVKVAAVLILGIIIGRFVFQAPSKPQADYYTSVAPKGSVSQMILPDSSSVFLNSGSTLKYKIDERMGKREVFLTGEAWFQVNKSKNKAFIVHTPYYDVNVTGTEFNVKAYPDDNDVVTTLEKGSVKITSGSSVILKEPAWLKPGQQIIYNKETENVSVKDVNTRWFTSWKDNKLIFVNMNLKELIILLERKYDVEIKIYDKEVLNYHYDGTLKDETILEVLNLLCETLPLQYKINNQIIEIKKK